jgi:hypothetical protein
LTEAVVIKRPLSQNFRPVETLVILARKLFVVFSIVLGTILSLRWKSCRVLERGIHLGYRSIEARCSPNQVYVSIKNETLVIGFPPLGWFLPSNHLRCLFYALCSRAGLWLSLPEGQL